MSTSGGGILNALAYLVVLIAVFRAVDSVTDGEALLKRPHRFAIVLWAMVAVPSVAQCVFPQIYDALSRQPDLVRDHGQWWRLITSAYVQDGGIFGTVFNLAMLYVIAALAIPLWGGVRTGALFVVATAAFDVPAVYFYPSAGGGNSGATFALATTLPVLLALRNRTRTVLVATAVTVVVGIVLVVIGDAHGFAFLGGVVAGGLLAAVAGPPTDRYGSPAVST